MTKLLQNCEPLLCKKEVLRCPQHCCLGTIIDAWKGLFAKWSVKAAVFILFGSGTESKGESIKITTLWWLLGYKSNDSSPLESSNSKQGSEDFQNENSTKVRVDLVSKVGRYWTLRMKSILAETDCHTIKECEQLSVWVLVLQTVVPVPSPLAGLLN